MYSKRCYLTTTYIVLITLTNQENKNIMSYNEVNVLINIVKMWLMYF